MCVTQGSNEEACHDGLQALVQVSASLQHIANSRKSQCAHLPLVVLWLCDMIEWRLVCLVAGGGGCAAGLTIPETALAERCTLPCHCRQTVHKLPCYSTACGEGGVPGGKRPGSVQGGDTTTNRCTHKAMPACSDVGVSAVTAASRCFATAAYTRLSGVLVVVHTQQTHAHTHSHIRTTVHQRC